MLPVATTDALSVVALLDGFVEIMGEGIFIVIQDDDQGMPQSVVLTEQDLRIMSSWRPR